MKTRWKILIGLGILLVLAGASLLVTMHVQPESALEAYKKSLRDRGEKLEIAELMPKPLPAESNSVTAVETAFGMFASSPEKYPYAMTAVAPGKALVGWKQTDTRGYDFTNSWEDFSAEVEADRPAIELLQQVLDRPRLDFQPDYKQDAETLLPHLVPPMRRAAQKLEAAAVVNLHNGNSGLAATNILTVLALAQKNSSEGLLISHLVRLAMVSIAIASTWEMLQATNVTDAQLAAVQRGWEQIDLLSDATNTVVMERAWSLNEIEKLRVSPQDLAGAVFMGSSGSGGGGWDWDAMTKRTREAIGEALWRSSWSYSDELQMLQTASLVLDTLRKMQSDPSEFYKADEDAMLARLPSFTVTNAGAAFFRALDIPDFSGVRVGEYFSSTVDKTIQFETARRVVLTAIALKRFQIKHGKWPETLGDLTPEFLRSVPIDPMDGKALKYHANADGTFLLYSSGKDGKDDGGDPTHAASRTSSFSWQHPQARDWVWPQPATEAEIEHFYVHPPE